MKRAPNTAVDSVMRSDVAEDDVIIIAATPLELVGDGSVETTSVTEANAVTSEGTTSDFPARDFEKVNIEGEGQTKECENDCRLLFFLKNEYTWERIKRDTRMEQGKVLTKITREI